MLKIDTNLPQIAKRLQIAGKLTAAQRQSVLKACGVSLLSNARRDFEAMSAGDTSSFGAAWKPLAESTLRARRRKNKRAAARGGKRKRKGSGGGGTAGIAEALDSSAVQMGVDTGRLRNSVQPGYTGDDGEGGNILEVTDHTVTVGYGRTYAKHFDAQRELLPAENEVPEKWTKDMEGIVSRAVTRSAQEAVKGKV